MLNRLEMLRVFCAAAEARNFKEAAQRLGLSPQVVTRAVRALESQLGEVLFHRNTRGSQITEFGQALLPQARASVDGLDNIFQQQGASKTSEIEGLVRITVPESLGAGFMVHGLTALRRDHPKLRFALTLSDQTLNVVDEKIDVGVRIGQMRDSRFVARMAAPVHLPIVGAPSLIERVGAPVTIADMDSRPTTALLDPNTGRPWPWYLADGEIWHPHESALVANNGGAEFQAVLNGMGFSQIPGYLAYPHVKAGRLVTVLDDLAPPPWNLNVFRPQQSPVPARVRVVFDWMVAYFSDPARFAHTLGGDD